MNKPKVKRILLKSLIKENQELERLGQGIHTQTMLGKYWLQMLSGLEMVQDEVKDFSGMYITLNKPKMYTKEAEETLLQVQQLLSKIYPTIRAMDEIQHRDMMS